MIFSSVFSRNFRVVVDFRTFRVDKMSQLRVRFWRSVTRMRAGARKTGLMGSMTCFYEMPTGLRCWVWRIEFAENIKNQKVPLDCFAAWSSRAPDWIAAHCRHPVCDLRSIKDGAPRVHPTGLWPVPPSGVQPPAGWIKRLHKCTRLDSNQ